jgi:general stress protein 26
MEKNLDQKEALKKFKKLAEEIRVCMFITNADGDLDHTRPMSTIEVEEDGSLWFFTDIRSIKVEEVATEKQVHLTYAHPGKESYMDVRGTAKIVTDKQQIKDKWSPIVRAWFPDGVDDPNIALLKVQPNHCYYWDAETGKMIQVLKMAVSAIAGKRLADGKEGKLSL